MFSLCRLPPVAYIKAVDVYLGFCYLLVVLALIEYACVAYSKVKIINEKIKHQNVFRRRMKIGREGKVN